MRHYVPAIRAHHYIVIAMAIVVLGLPNLTRGQSGSKPRGGTPQTASRSMKTGLEGYCPVCILEMKKWVRGNPQFKSTFDGQVYLFPGKEQKTTFDANPAKYVPTLGGDCIVAYKKMNKRIAGNIRHAAFASGRLFLFSSAAAKKEFIDNQETYVDADIALGGKCSVCKVEMQKDVDGRSEIAIVHNGLRYYFPGSKQRDMFVGNPSKYAIGKSGSVSKTKGSSKK